MSAGAIPEEIVSLLEGGVASWLACGDASGIPEATRVRGTRVWADRRGVTVLVPKAQSGVVFENLRTRLWVAVFYCRVTDYVSFQIKGRVRAIRSSDSADRGTQARHMREFIDECARLGVPAAVMERHAYWPSLAVDIEVSELFGQTPGKGAGLPWRQSR